LSCREEASELHSSIYKYALDNPNATTNDVAKAFYISPSTAKRAMPTITEKLEYYRNRVAQLERELEVNGNKVVMNRSEAINVLAHIHGFDKVMILASK
jgi:deoxyribodipyrimidine photolyase